MRLIFFIIAFFCVHACMGQQQAIVYDSSAIPVRSFNTEKIKAFIADKDFQYSRYTEPPASAWDRFWQWFWEKIGDMLSTRGGATTFKIVTILLAVFILLFFIYRLTGMNKAGLFKRNNGDVSGFSVSDENIHTINFEAAIQEAIENNNYRLAVRLLYLQSLKKLADKNLISWQLNKTNIAYLEELKGSSYQPSFSNLTWQFESNWYGDMPIAAAEFNAVHEQFNKFNTQLV